MDEPTIQNHDSTGLADELAAQDAAQHCEPADSIAFSTQPVDLTTASRNEIDTHFMRLALQQAKAAQALGEVPIGAVVAINTTLISAAHNRRETDADPSAHAEFLALTEASKRLGRWRLSDCTVYVTLEPCPMCAGLMHQARIARCVYGAPDPKAGALGSLYDIHADPRLNHNFDVTTAVLEKECSAVLSTFFENLRSQRAAKKPAPPE